MKTGYSQINNGYRINKNHNIMVLVPLVPRVLLQNTLGIGFSAIMSMSVIGYFKAKSNHINKIRSI